MSFFGFTKKCRDSYSLVFNIGSGSISGGIIKFTEKAGVDMVYYQKESIPFQLEISIPKHLELMKSTLDILANKIQSEGLKKLNLNTGKNIRISKVFYAFSSPWSISQTKTIRIKESKPFKVTDIYLNHIIEEQEKQFQTDIAKNGKIIENKIIQVKINDYVINDFNNKLAKNLELSVFLTVVPEEILQIVDDAVSKTFHLKDIYCHSSALATFSVIRNLFPQKEDFISIDISEEITDISVIKDNIITSNVSIPFGRNHFIRELSIVLNVSEEIADSMVNMHNTKDNDELAAMKLSVAMDKAAVNWFTKILSVLDSLKEKIYVPESIFLIANNDLANFLKDKLERHDFKVLLIDNKKIKSPVIVESVLFKLILIFFDKLYKI